MPSLLTHNFFAEDFLSNLNDGSCLVSYSNAFKLGTQGPDPLFFSNYLPSNFSLKMLKEKYGSKLHRLDGKLLFKEAFKIIENYLNMIYEKPYDEEALDEAIVFQNTHKQAARIKCATIGWNGLTKLLNGEKDED